MVDTDSATGADTTDTVMDTPTPDTDTTMARGPLMPSPRLRQRPMPLSSMAPTDTPMGLVPTAMALSDTLDIPMA